MAKYLEDKLTWAVEDGDSPAVDLARQDLEREGSEHYKGDVVRSRLKTVKCNALAPEDKGFKLKIFYWS